MCFNLLCSYKNKNGTTRRVKVESVEPLYCFFRIGRKNRKVWLMPNEHDDILHCNNKFANYYVATKNDYYNLLINAVPTFGILLFAYSLS